MASMDRRITEQEVDALEFKSVFLLGFNYGIYLPEQMGDYVRLRIE